MTLFLYTVMLYGILLGLAACTEGVYNIYLLEQSVTLTYMCYFGHITFFRCIFCLFLAAFSNQDHIEAGYLQVK